MSDQDNPPAFPMGNPEQGGHDGMTLRDWFAGQALAGLLANQQATPFGMSANSDSFARRAFHISDAMIAARKKDGGG